MFHCITADAIAHAENCGKNLDIFQISFDFSSGNKTNIRITKFQKGSCLAL